MMFDRRGRRTAIGVSRLLNRAIGIPLRRKARRGPESACEQRTSACRFPPLLRSSRRRPVSRPVTGAGRRRVAAPPRTDLDIMEPERPRSCPPAAAIEVFAFGRRPLAISARCCHARARAAQGRLPFRLRPGPRRDGGRDARRRAVPRRQRTADAVARGHEPRRRQPRRRDMVAVARIVRDALDGQGDPAGMHAALSGLLPGIPFANGFLHGRPGAVHVTAAV